MKSVATWSVAVLLAGSAVVAGQVDPRVRRADPVPARTTIRVPEDVASLQEAIRRSSPGGLILVKGEHGFVTVDRPLAIVGDPEASVDMGCFPVGITLAGPGHGEVTLAGLSVGSLGDCIRQTGIQGGGFDELHVFDSDVVSRSPALSGLGYGGPAIDVDVPLVVLSGVYARSAQPDVDMCRGLLPDENHAAVEAPNSTVILVDSTLEGGPGGWLCCRSCTCPVSLVGLGGEGGDALVAREAYVANSTLAGGAGSTYWAFGASSQVVCGTQPDGRPAVAEELVPLANDLQGAPRLVLGAPYALSWSLAGPLVGIWVADELREPVPVGADGWSFLVPRSTVFLGAFPATPSSLAFQVPPAVHWLGERFAFQAAALDGTVSRPVLAAVTP